MAKKRKREIKWGKYMDLLRKKVCSWTPLWGMSLVHPRLSCFCVCLRTISLLFRQQPYPVHRVELILEKKRTVFPRIFPEFFRSSKRHITVIINGFYFIYSARCNRFFYKLFETNATKSAQYWITIF